MRIVSCLIVLLAIVVVPDKSRAATRCSFITDEQLSSATSARWSLISNQDGRGCIYTGEHNDTLMLVVFRNPNADRAKDLYATFVKTLGERMPVAPVSGIGSDARAGATSATASRPEAAIVSLSGEYILQINLYPSGRQADQALVRQLSEVARVAIGNVSATSERFGGCEWLTADDAEGFLDRATLTVQRTGPGSCLMFDSGANTLMVAVIAMSRDEQINLMRRAGACKRVVLSELGQEAFGEHSCSGGNTQADSIYIWKNGRQAHILFAPTQQHPQSGSVDRLKAVAARVLSKM